MRVEPSGYDLDARLGRRALCVMSRLAATSPDLTLHAVEDRHVRRSAWRTDGIGLLTQSQTAIAILPGGRGLRFPRSEVQCDEATPA